MTVTVRELISAKFAENVQTTQYTATNCTAIIDKFTATNIGAVNSSLSANLIVSGGSAGTSNLVMKTRTLAPGETYTCPELVGQALVNGSFISVLAGAPSAIVIRASGREIT